jgi:tetratricopeptide (TPR) repeat protein
MSTFHSSERLGEAWRHHRDGNNEQAITIFKDIIHMAPENVDAHYGLGLSYKASSDMASAADAFQKALNFAEHAYNAVKTTSEAEGHHGANDLDTSDDDRFMMLSKMLKQRLEDVGVSESAS